MKLIGISILATCAAAAAQSPVTVTATGAGNQHGAVVQPTISIPVTPSTSISVTPSIVLPAQGSPQVPHVQTGVTIRF